ncbi:MAG: hypothetical protein IOC49_06720 [Methylobacterium sp.]|nr:hypothetical protein [Methylobacterium sp.]
MSQERTRGQTAHPVEKKEKSNDFNAWRFSVAPMMDGQVFDFCADLSISWCGRRRDVVKCCIPKRKKAPTIPVASPEWSGRIVACGRLAAQIASAAK